MESGSNVSVGKEVSPKDVGLENKPERLPKRGQKVLRAPLWEDRVTNYSRALALAGAVASGFGGAGFSNDVQAQQMQNQWANPPTVAQAGYGQTRVSAGRVLAGVGVAIAANEILQNTDIPARVGVGPNGEIVIQVNLNGRPKLEINIYKDAQEVMQGIGLNYNAKPFYIVSSKFPDGTKINIGPDTLDVKVLKAGDSTIYVDVLSQKPGQRRVLERILVGVDQNGQMMTAVLASQPL